MLFLFLPLEGILRTMVVSFHPDQMLSHTGVQKV